MSDSRHARGLPKAIHLPIPHTHYIRDEYLGIYRIWNSWDPGDVFDTVLIGEFEPHVLAFVKARPSQFVADFPEADDGTTKCPLCVKNGE